jgi:hypothetical protein
VFSRAIPFKHLGSERDVRVFIARSLGPGEAGPVTVAMTAEAMQRQKAVAAAAKAGAEVGAFSKLCACQWWQGGVQRFVCLFGWVDG